MQRRIHVLTLGVDDLDRSLRFYRALGLESPGIVGSEFTGDATHAAGDVVMFPLEGGLTLALYPRPELAKDANLRVETPSATEFSIGHIVSGKAEVDALIEKARAAGATVTDEPHDRPWGIYSGYFRDPDGHLWEVIWSSQADT